MGATKAKNRYDRMEWAGAFGDIGTLIPFVVAYTTVVGIEPMGLLLVFGSAMIASGLYYRTPLPIQPMKAIGAAAVAGHVPPVVLFGAGITTGIFWLLLGLSGALQGFARVARKPVVHGIMLGLGLSFMHEGIARMRSAPLLAGMGLVITWVLLRNPKVPAMLVLLVVGVGASFILDPGLGEALAALQIGLKAPTFALHDLTFHDLARGTLLFTLPQIPLTLGSGIIALTAENNKLFPDRRISERQVAVSTGIMNLCAPVLGGVPLCHGAGGMAAHVRFGARTGGALVLLGTMLVVIALFLSDSIGILLRAFPEALLGVVLFLAGAELAMVVREGGEGPEGFYVMIIVAGFAMWHMGVAFLVGVILDQGLRRSWIRM
jgi:hypothetical protein